MVYFFSSTPNLRITYISCHINQSHVYTLIFSQFLSKHWRESIFIHPNSQIQRNPHILQMHLSDFSNYTVLPSLGYKTHYCKILWTVPWSTFLRIMVCFAVSTQKRLPFCFSGKTIVNTTLWQHPIKCVSLELCKCHEPVKRCWLPSPSPLQCDAPPGGGGGSARFTQCLSTQVNSLSHVKYGKGIHQR